VPFLVIMTFSVRGSNIRNDCITSYFAPRGLL
jgi:hypothetical protein